MEFVSNLLQFISHENHNKKYTQEEFDYISTTGVYKCKQCDQFRYIPRYRSFKYIHCLECEPNKRDIKIKSDTCSGCSKQNECIYVNENGTYKPK